MGRGIAFDLSKTLLKDSIFKIESGSADASIMISIIDEEVANGYDPISITSDGNGLCFILFKKRGV